MPSLRGRSSLQAGFSLACQDEATQIPQLNSGAFHSSPIETAYAGFHLHAQSLIVSLDELLSLGRRNTNR